MDLAKALNVPLKAAEGEGDWYTWGCYLYECLNSYNDIKKQYDFSELLELIEPVIEENRQKYLQTQYLKLGSEVKYKSLFNNSEKLIISVADTTNRLYDEEGYHNHLSSYYINSELTFEAELDETGHIEKLKSPYMLHLKVNRYFLFVDDDVYKKKVFDDLKNEKRLVTEVWIESKSSLRNMEKHALNEYMEKIKWVKSKFRTVQIYFFRFLNDEN